MVNKKYLSNDKMLFSEIRELIVSARKAVVRNVDTIQVITNFEIGRRILEHEQQGEERAEYGTALLKDLSKKLSKEFGRGFSERNLEYMRKFYLLYQNRFGKISQMASAKLVDQGKSQTASGKLKKTEKAFTKLQTTVFPLSWSQYVFLLGVKDDDSRSFYVSNVITSFTHLNSVSCVTTSFTLKCSFK
jgi:hypothetical protein